MRVRPAAPGDVAAMQDVERSAGALFRTIDEPRIARCADDPPMSIDELRAYIDAGRAFVAVDDGGTPVGFVALDVVDGCAHIEEVAVHADAQGRGSGTALLDAAASWATASELPAVTLTTFRDVPWNAPYYSRRGYRVLADAELTGGLRAKVAAEAVHGLDPELRVVMRRDLP
jgi:GNAT superfamily N-acetyltransferase